MLQPHNLDSLDDAQSIFQSHTATLLEHGSKIGALEKDVAVLVANQNAIKSAQDTINASVHKIELAMVRIEGAQSQVAANLEAHINSLKVLIHSTSQESRAQLSKHERDEFAMQRDLQKTNNRNLMLMMSIGLSSVVVVLFAAFIGLFKLYVVSA